MTPEEAKPQTICIMSEMTFADGMFQGPIREGFTVKETAEIAKAYGMACLHSYMDKAAETAERFEDLFKEWSK